MTKRLCKNYIKNNQACKLSYSLAINTIPKETSKGSYPFLQYDNKLCAISNTQIKNMIQTKIRTYLRKYRDVYMSETQ